MHIFSIVVAAVSYFFSVDVCIGPIVVERDGTGLGTGFIVQEC